MTLPKKGDRITITKYVQNGRKFLPDSGGGELMSKLTKLLSVFVIASTVTAGVAALAGCHTHTYDEKWSTSETQHWHAATCAHEDQKKDLGDHVDANDDGKCDVCGYQMEVEEEHTHTYSNEWTSDATQHWHAATCEHTDQKKDAANHVDANEDGKCDVCGYQMQTAPEVEGIPAPEGTSGLIIEKTTTTYTLSAASPTVDISTADLKVYYADAASEKLGEVDLSKATITYFKGSETLENLNGVSSAGTYMIYVKLEGVLPEGATETVDLSAFISITVNDPVVADTLAINADAVKTQTQSTTDSMTSTWKFTVTLASGAKVDVTEDVTISGVETTAVGEREATVTITYDEVNFTLKVPYSITADQNSHSVSYAVNFGGMEIAPTPVNTELKQGDVVVGKILASDGKAKVSASTKEIDGKIFTQRFQFGGGSFDKNGNVQFDRVIEINTLGAAKITIYWATADADRGIALYDVDDYTTITTSSQSVIKDLSAESSVMKKSVANVSEEGKYYLTSANTSDVYIFYIQVDNIVSGAGEDVGLPTETETQSIDVETENATTVYKVGDTFTSEGLVIKEAVVNPVTCDATYRTVTDTSTVTYTGYDLTKLGEQTVTVTYGEFKTTYNITVESAVAGITGVSASLKDGFNNQLAEGQTTLTVKKSDIVVSPVGENAEATVTSYTVKLNGEEIDETGKALAAGEYTVTVEAVVSDGTNTANLTCTYTFSIVGQGLQDVKYTITAEDVDGIGGDKITEEYVLVPGTITVGTGNKAGSNDVTIDDIKYTNRVQLGGSFKADNVGNNSIKLNLVSGATIKVIYASSGDAARTLSLYNSNGEKVVAGTAVDKSGVLQSYTVDAGGTFYLGSEGSSINIWYIEIDYAGN